MTRFPFLKMVMIGVVCAAVVTACGRREQGGITMAPTQGPSPTTLAAQPTNLPPVTQPTSAPTLTLATVPAAVAATPTSSAQQGDAQGATVEESLQQLDDSLNSTDTADNLQDDPKEDTAGQSLQQLGDDLGKTDTLADMPGN